MLGWFLRAFSFSNFNEAKIPKTATQSQLKFSSKDIFEIYTIFSDLDAMHGSNSFSIHLT